MKKKLLSTKTIFSRILLFNIILVVMVTIIPQTIFINYFKTTYDSEINKYNMQTVKQVQRSIDELIVQQVVNIPNNYFSELYSNLELTYPINYDISKDFTRIAAVKKRLADIRSTLDFLDSIEVYYTKGNLLFSDISVQFLDDGANSKSPNIEWIRRFQDTDINLAWIPTRKFGEASQVARSVTTYVKSIPYFADRNNRQAIICVNIKEEVLRKYFNDIKPFGEQQFLILSDDGSIVTRNGDDSQSWDLKVTDISRQVFGSSEAGLFQTKLQGKMSVISYSKSKYNNWRYVSITSVDDFYKKSSQLKNFLLAVAILLLIINLTASVIVTKRAHKPMDAIIRAVNSIAKVFNNEEAHAMNEYNLLSSTINGLADKVDDLNHKLDISKPIIRHNAVLKLLNGKLSIANNEQLMDLQFKMENIACFMLKVFQNKNMSFENEMLIGYNIIDLLENSRGVYHIRAVINDNNIIAGIINFDSLIRINTIVEDITKQIESLINVQYTLCLGNTYSLGSEKICKSYQEASECSKYTFLQSGQKVLNYHEITSRYVKDTGNSLRILEKIEDSLRSGDEEKLKFSLDSIVEAMEAGNYRIDYCKNTLMDVVSTIRNTAIGMGYDEEAVFEYDIREYYKSIENIEDFNLWIHKVVDSVLYKINEKRQSVNKDFDAKIIIYIDTHIFQDLSLDTVAEALFVSPSYVSKAVKAMTGKSFTDYVIEVKLQHAAMLLAQQNITVKALAAKLGYNSTQYFIRIFREKYGHTPKEYQKVILESDIKTRK